MTDANTARKFDVNDFISEKEREHMLFELHRYLVWVGETIPDEITIQDQNIKLHDLIWKLIEKGTLTEKEKQGVRQLIRKLEQKEEFDEERLKKARLTRSQAEQLHDEAAGLIRAVMDLKDLENGKIKEADFDEFAIRNTLEDARNWVKFIKKIKE